MRRWPRAPTLLALAVCGACTEPDRPFAVVVASPPRVASTPLPEHPTEVTCDYDITAWGEGGERGDVAVWEAATIEWREGGAVLFTETWTRAQILSFFRSETIARGEVQTARIYTSSFGGSPTPPYSLTHQFHYRVPSGELKTAATTTTCE